LGKGKDWGLILILVVAIGAISVMPSSFAGDNTVPDRIEDLTLSHAAGTQMNLSWSTPDDGGSPITGYIIQSKVNGVITTIETSYGDAASVSYSDYSLSHLDEVTYRIAAINAEGQAPFSNVPDDQITSDGGGGKTIPGIITDLALNVG